MRFERTAASDAAARKWGVDPQLWHEVHSWHADRTMVAVETTQAKLAGVITGIRNEGFKVGTFGWLDWNEVLVAVAVREDETRGTVRDTDGWHGVCEPCGYRSKAMKSEPLAHSAYVGHVCGNAHRAVIRRRRREAA